MCLDWILPHGFWLDQKIQQAFIRLRLIFAVSNSTRACACHLRTCFENGSTSSVYESDCHLTQMLSFVTELWRVVRLRISLYQQLHSLCKMLSDSFTVTSHDHLPSFIVSLLDHNEKRSLSDWVTRRY